MARANIGWVSKKYESVRPDIRVSPRCLPRCLLSVTDLLERGRSPSLLFWLARIKGWGRDGHEIEMTPGLVKKARSQTGVFVTRGGLFFGIRHPTPRGTSRWKVTTHPFRYLLADQVTHNTATMGREIVHVQAGRTLSIDWRVCGACASAPGIAAMLSDFLALLSLSR